MKEYSWFPENGNCPEIYGSIEKAVADAQYRYDERLEEFEDRDGVSPVISAGPVRRFDLKAAVEEIVGSIEDSIWEQLHDFSFGCDTEVECSVNEKDQADFKKEAISVLFPLIEKYIYINPEWVCRPERKYDLRNRMWVD